MKLLLPADPVIFEHNRDLFSKWMDETGKENLKFFFSTAYNHQGNFHLLIKPGTPYGAIADVMEQMAKQLRADIARGQTTKE